MILKPADSVMEQVKNLQQQVFFRFPGTVSSSVRVVYGRSMTQHN